MSRVPVAVRHVCACIATSAVLCVPGLAAVPPAADQAPGEQVTEQGWGTMSVGRR